MKRLVYRMSKTITFEAAHSLEGLPVGHKCRNLHGHSYRMIFSLVATNLDEVGMILDFDVLEAIRSKVDHTNLNDVFKPLNPTAENVARWAYETVNQILLSLDAQDDVYVEKITLYETPDSFVEVWAEEMPAS